MAIARLLAVSLLAFALAACSTGKPKRIFPPTASLQQVDVRADGSWGLTLRLQNFSNVGMRMDQVEARLEVGAVHAGDLALAPGIVVPAGSVELVSATLSPSPRAAEAMQAVLVSRTGLRYRLSGMIRSSEPDRRRDDFEFESSVAPVPGLDNTLR